MIRFLFSVALMVILGVIFFDRVKRTVDWYIDHGSAGYWPIVLGFSIFIGLVYLFDEYAEESGLIVHHWWD